jgi:CubicO group peptidase (beta-lactamase class C family)
MGGSTDAIGGTTAPGFERVRAVFEKNFADGREVGAAFAAYHRGEKVVDLWGGIADKHSGRPWGEDTMVLVYSTTKGATAMCAHKLAQEGKLDFDAPVASYWPEFARAGKEKVTVAHLLSHRAGLPWTDGKMSLEDALAWDPVVRALEAQAPVWEPGTEHGYHATTYGWLVGEVVRRISGRSIGTYLAEEIAGPLGADFHIGLPADDEPRVARLVSFVDALVSGDLDAMNGLAGLSGEGGPGGAAVADLVQQYLAPGAPLMLALSAPGGAFADQSVWDSRALHAAEVPAANGICDARSLALLYGACVSEASAPSGEKIRILDPDQIDRAVAQQTEGPDRVLLGLDIQWGLGFMVNRGVIAQGGIGGPRSFGHFGMGGSTGWADPDLELGMGYVMNRMDLGVSGDTRSYGLMKACIEAAGSE